MTRQEAVEILGQPDGKSKLCDMLINKWWDDMSMHDAAVFYAGVVLNGHEGLINTPDYQILEHLEEDGLIS